MHLILWTCRLRWNNITRVTESSGRLHKQVYAGAVFSCATTPKICLLNVFYPCFIHIMSLFYFIKSYWSFFYLHINLIYVFMLSCTIWSFIPFYFHNYLFHEFPYSFCFYLIKIVFIHFYWFPTRISLHSMIHSLFIFILLYFYMSYPIFVACHIFYFILI